MTDFEIKKECLKIEKETGIPTMDVLKYGAEGLADVIIPYIR